MKKITGKTKVLGVIGDPIAHSLSPKLHQYLAYFMGHDLVYVPFHVKKEDLKDAIKGAYALGIQGLNVTMPHKQEVLKHLAACDEEARLIRSCNTLCATAQGYKGYNTDTEGLRRGMMRHEITWQAKDVAIIGAGGAAYAACLSVVKEAKSISVFNRTVCRSQALKKVFEKDYTCPIHVYEMDEVPNFRHHLIIQTTGVGMAELKECMPSCTEALIHKEAQVVEMIYEPWETLFLQYAKAKGCKVMNGFDMLFEQGVKAYECFTQQLVPNEVVEQVRLCMLEES